LFWHAAHAFQVTHIKVNCGRDERFVKAGRVNPSKFLTELKRRNVYRAAVAYGVVAWFLTQLTTQVFPFFEIPNSAVRFVVIALALGFPIAMLLSWVYEFTPEGIVRTEDLHPAQARSIQRATGRILDFIIIGALLLVIAMLIVGRHPFYRQTGESISQKSIAVLPFENLSEDKANAYFADGIQDEILTRLSKIADLKVISRTSTQHYKSAPENLPEIAKQLGVAHILEGSVQKSGDAVRVNVELIKAASDSHLWADTFDRKLTDIFGVESEIAKAIAKTLQAKLTGSEEDALSVRPTDNPVAHELYLKGRFFWNKRTGNDLRKSVDYFNQAIQADPNYALAYAGLADVYVLLPGLRSCTPKDCYPKAKAAATKALELDATLAEAHATLATVLSFYDLNFAQASIQFERAIELNPNYAIAHQWYGDHLLISLGRFDEAIAQEKRALELDPLSLIAHTDLAQVYRQALRLEEAIAESRKALELDPNFHYAYRNLGLVFEMKGDFAGAIGAYQKERALNDDPQVVALLAHAYGSSGNQSEALKMVDQLKELSKERYVSAYDFARAYLGLGDKEEALRWLDKSYQDRAGNDIGRIKIDAFLDPLRGDPRFEALVAKVFAPKNGSWP
jgi:TolB-like protein/tetratricopeptide (TPR) repeat protein